MLPAPRPLAIWMRRARASTMGSSLPGRDRYSSILVATRMEQGGYPGLRPTLMALLACPECHGDLEVVEAAQAGTEALRSATLRCGACCARFPVRHGIPRFGTGGGEAVARETARSFGFQWKRYARRIPEWKRRCREFFGRFAPEDLGRGVVLDAGCGYGRWLAEVAEGGGVAVGMDVSEAVDAAAGYLGASGDCHLVQGDILNPPFKPGVFETVYSIGVLHHLTRGAAEGIRALRPLVRPGGLLFVWLYGSHRGDDRSGLYPWIRLLTRRAPRPLLAAVCAVGAALVSLVFVWPKRLLARSPRTRGLSDRIPFHTYRDLPMSELRADLFDMFATPIEHGYGKGAVRAMLEESGLEAVDVTALGTPRNPEASWRGWGYAPQA